MKKTILVFSDSHNSVLNMAEVIEKYNNVECVFFLGDGINDTKYLSLPITTGLITVRGNCDFGSSEPVYYIAEIEGFRFMLSHGDAYSVKQGVERYAAFAINNRCDMALFGHTHIPYTDTVEYDGKRLYIMNPGSISLPRGGKPSYGVITIDGKKLEFEIRTI